MAKPNIHTASREELAEAGVRAELVAEILKLRRKGTVALEALDALPGVGPVTLEQLRQSLDLSDKAPSNGDAPAVKGAVSSVKIARQAEVDANATNSTAKVVRQTEADTNETRSSIKVARQAEGSANEAAGSAVQNAAEATRSTAEAGARVTSTAAHSGQETIQRTARATTEAGQETMRRAAEGRADVGQTLTELWNEQTRHNLEVLTAFGRAVNWAEVVRVQSQFVRASFERITRMNRSYLKIIQPR